MLPSFLEEKIKSLPQTPGVYFFKDTHGNPIYIGKALSIKKRVMGHFRFFGEAFSKEGVMLGEVRRIDFMETPTEAEALLLESSLVKQYLPKYNQMLKDDKSYPFLKITDQEYPRLIITRGRKADGGKYFGPYTNVRLLRQALKMLRRQFPMRTCKTFPKKVCLMYHIGLCGGPCEGFQGLDEYMSRVKDLENFLSGRRDGLVKELMRRMREYSANKEYEKAKALYDSVKALSSVPAATKKVDLNKVLEDLRQLLSLEKLPQRIECFDISNISGKEAVGSMVVFEGGEPARAQYRRFRIKTVQGIDDYKMMQEMLTRRLDRSLDKNSADPWPMPDLVIIDGGKGHLSAAKEVVDEKGLSDLALISIAKEHEHLFKPDSNKPIILSLSSPILELIRRLRDEAHRFAITYHRGLHRKEAFVSILDTIPGVGPKTRQKILKTVGSTAKIKSLTPSELSAKTNIPLKTAQTILDKLTNA